ncbi:Cell wall-associated hydrolase, NlpC family [Streptococcus equinus]|uniref:Cell wall-associated hydrolase, NlpC family n=1 Tax=Streptococcus equinus TaxID=1335 RepID=A0A239RG82_STREI|nr:MULTISPECIES: NlpC/P60 family protein [Bacillota]MBQ3781962.1 C40 family peptidase [Lachnospiraceae bacterium]MBU9744278.1 C40 family peptidase [Diplocloster agilis]SNU09480.1 Cell wall-associated hydrolase, NlpC family [Streptococcus equinus]
MEFNASGAVFAKKNNFADSMRQFISEEAAIFSPEKEEAASASMDRTAEKIVRFSADKSKVKVKEQKRILDSIKGDNTKSETGHVAEGKTEIKAVSSKMDKFTDERSGSDVKASQSKPKEVSSSERSAKKAKSKETKAAATKTAVANLFKAKADMSNDLVSEKVTGDALRDGNSGLVKTFTTVINPMTYVKKWLAKLAALIAPYILIFTSIAAVVFIIIALLFSVLQPIAEVGEALSGFVAMFTGDGGGLRNTSFSDGEIDEIVAASGADETQEKVIRYALSKVGYPYSQDYRTSGKAYDCSSLAYYSWENAGVDISYGTNYPPTAAEGARMLEARSKKLSTSDLKPGDLIYYGGEANGRYMGIYHVAIYVGDGKAVEALSTKYGVVYQKLRTKNACMVCRPNM